MEKGKAGSGGRRWAVRTLVVVTTLAILVVSVDGQDSTVRLIAVLLAAASGAGSLVLAKKRGNLLGWYAIALGVAVLRIVMVS